MGIHEDAVMALNKVLNDLGRGGQSRVSERSGIAVSQVKRLADGTRNVGFETASAILDAIGGRIVFLGEKKQQEEVAVGQDTPGTTPCPFQLPESYGFIPRLVDVNMSCGMSEIDTLRALSAAIQAKIMLFEKASDCGKEDVGA